MESRYNIILRIKAYFVWTSVTVCRNSAKRLLINSAKYKIAYIKHLVNTYDHDHVLFMDANFTLDRDITLAFCNEMIESGLSRQVTFFCETNVSMPLDRELVNALSKAGCTQISLGVERLSPDALGKINKNKNYDLMLENLNRVHQAGIPISINLLLGLPFDTPKTVFAEERLLANIIHEIDWVSVLILMPVPGTDIFNRTLQKKWYLEKQRLSWKPPFYHYAFNYNGDAIYKNYFNLSAETLSAIMSVKEKFFEQGIKKLNSRLINLLWHIEKILARLSLKLFNVSPVFERIIFGPILFVYNDLWRSFVDKFFVIHPGENIK